MKIINEIVLNNKRTNQVRHFFNTDHGQLLITYHQHDTGKHDKVKSQRELINSSLNIMDYHDQLFAQRFDNIIKKTLD